MIKRISRNILFLLFISILSACEKCTDIKGKLDDFDATHLTLTGSYNSLMFNSSFKMINDTLAIFEYESNKKKYTFYYKVSKNGTYNKTILKKP